MKIILDKANPDILIPCEGTYPYVRGGVSSWIAQLIAGLPQYTFGIIFIGSKKEEYPSTALYEFSDNLVFLTETFVFDDEKQPKIQAKNGSVEDFKHIEQLYNWFKSDKKDLAFPEKMKNLDFFLNNVDKSTFLYSRESWYFASNKYNENASDVSFLDYFWSVRSIHIPIWKMAELAKLIGNRGKIIHSPSTGYAGFLSTLITHHTNKPFILTEHGIYTKERKIDLISDTLGLYKKIDLFKDSAENDYIQNMWIKFFEGIGKMSYSRANPILSLFSVAKETQIAYGANPNLCQVIANGVDIETLSNTLQYRPTSTPKVITLIGRVVSIKDIKTFIRAIRVTANEIPDVEAWIVGPDDEEKEYAQECRELIEILELQNHIKFLGFQKITAILPKSGLLTLTSISEGMPLVILEGFAAGLPCVSTDVGSCKELIYGGDMEGDKELGEAGVVCQIANVEQLSNAYIELLNDENKWKQAQKAALKRVNKFYTQEIFLNNYQKIYENTLKKVSKAWQE